MTEEPRLFWFHFRFRYWHRDMGETETREATCFEGFDMRGVSPDLINMSRIAQARRTAKVPENALLLSVSPLGIGTRTQMLA